MLTVSTVTLLERECDVTLIIKRVTQFFVNVRGNRNKLEHPVIVKEFGKRKKMLLRKL